MDVSTGVVLLMVAVAVCVFWVSRRRGASPRGSAGRRYRRSHDDGDVMLWSAGAGAAGSGAYSDANAGGPCESGDGNSDDAGSCDSDGGGGGGD